MATFRAKSDKVQNQQLKVQELTIRFADTQLYVVDGADVLVDVQEPVAAVVSCMHQDDSAAGADGLITIAAAALSVEDGDATDSTIRIDTVTLAADDVLHLKYITQG